MSTEEEGDSEVEDVREGDEEEGLRDAGREREEGERKVHGFQSAPERDVILRLIQVRRRERMGIFSSKNERKNL